MKIAELVRRHQRQPSRDERHARVNSGRKRAAGRVSLLAWLNPQGSVAAPPFSARPIEFDSHRHFKLSRANVPCFMISASSQTQYTIVSVATLTVMTGPPPTETLPPGRKSHWGYCISRLSDATHHRAVGKSCHRVRNGNNMSGRDRLTSPSRDGLAAPEVRPNWKDGVG